VYDDLQAMMRPSMFSPSLSTHKRDMAAREGNTTVAFKNTDDFDGDELVYDDLQAMLRPSMLSPTRSERERNPAADEPNQSSRARASGEHLSFQLQNPPSPSWDPRPPPLNNLMSPLTVSSIESNKGMHSKSRLSESAHSLSAFGEEADCSVFQTARELPRDKSSDVSPYWPRRGENSSVLLSSEQDVYMPLPLQAEQTLKSAGMYQAPESAFTLTAAERKMAEPIYDQARDNSL
jgi:hypothetical protein